MRTLIDEKTPVVAGDLRFTLHRAVAEETPDLLELSLSFEATRKALGDHRYRALPVYTSRAFRHGDIFVQTERGIRAGVDLSGRRVGTTAYDGTGCVWIRAILEEEYGLAPDSVQWVRGEVEKPYRGGADTPPPGVLIEAAPEGRSLSELLEAGQLDALICPHPPSCLTRGASSVARLFPDHIDREDALFRAKGIYPINHVMGIRRELVGEHPGLSDALFDAFVDAKRKALPSLRKQSGYDRLATLMGPDICPYGLAGRERATLDYFLRNHFRQGLSKRKVTVDELFMYAVASETRLLRGACQRSGLRPDPLARNNSGECHCEKPEGRRSNLRNFNPTAALHAAGNRGAPITGRDSAPDWATADGRSAWPATGKQMGRVRCRQW